MWPNPQKTADLVTFTKEILKVSEYIFFLKSENTIFLHKAMKKPYLNLHFNFHDFLPWNNEDMKILSFGFYLSKLKLV